MSSARVEFAHVWKKFRYGEIRNTLRQVIPALAARALGRQDPDEGRWRGEFWALRDVSFEVHPGEALGIIGPNGAGKSTVLKLLARILHPTRGRCAARGRVGALLEVAAGFHPDLTGRENIFLQGAILGMSRPEISRKFEQIVEFSGIRWFIDTPVKRYSSGMQARLGFSIAAHLDPDVLLIDEVLTVGDVSFQQKAFDCIGELVRRGIPTVVVSHQLDAIACLCTHAILLDRGDVVRTGTPQEAIAAYLHGGADPGELGTASGALRIDSLRVASDVVSSGGRVALELACVVREDGWVDPESVAVRVRSAQTGEPVFETSTLRLGIALPHTGQFTVELNLQLNVPPGVYLVESFIWDRIMERESFTGPSTHVEVRGGAEFRGIVQMNPRMRLGADTGPSVAGAAPR
jgi:ABC-type polysaccharide/polyol phosphate transport system ATPase subunit